MVSASVTTWTAVRTQSRRPPDRPSGRSVGRGTGALGAGARPLCSTTVIGPGRAASGGWETGRTGSSRFKNLAVHLHRLLRHPTPGERLGAGLAGQCESLSARLVFQELA